MSFEQDCEVAKQIYRDKPKEPDGRLSGCTSYLQRKMQIAYNPASRILEHLEGENFITAPDKDGKRRLCAEDTTVRTRDDLVGRLRRAATPNGWAGADQALVEFAANEIEALRTVITVARYQLRHCETKMPHSGLRDAIVLCSKYLDN